MGELSATFPQSAPHYPAPSLPSLPPSPSNHLLTSHPPHRLCSVADGTITGLPTLFLPAAVFSVLPIGGTGGRLPFWIWSCSFLFLTASTHKSELGPQQWLWFPVFGFVSVTPWVSLIPSLKDISTCRQVRPPQGRELSPGETHFRLLRPQCPLALGSGANSGGPFSGLLGF